MKTRIAIVLMVLAGCSKGSAVDSGGLTAIDARTGAGGASGADVTGSSGPVVAMPAADAASRPCVTDADCRLFDDYCTGCDCRVLLRADPDPTCPGPGVRCLRQPCADRVAACQQGECIVRNTPRR
jgi:hypothetical protein